MNKSNKSYDSYDFNTSDATDVAIMPMKLATMLFSTWVKSMDEDVYELREDFIYKLRTCKDVESLVYVCNEFLFERNLIEDIKKNVYDKYRI